MSLIPVHVVDPQKTSLIMVGVGGTGGYVLQQVARLLYALREQGKSIPSVLLIDGDIVEEKNLLRQYFLPQDLKRNKAEVLAGRYGQAYGLDIAAYPQYLNADTKFSELIDMVTPRVAYHQEAVPIVVGCVDNAPTRKILHDECKQLKHVVYIDSGNGSIDIPDDPAHLDRYQLSKIKGMGWDGQVVAGVRKNDADVLPFPGEVFPNLIEPDEEDVHPSEVRCGEVVVSQPQRLMTNVMAATTVLTYLHTLLADGTLLHHRTFFDARKGFMRAEAAIDHMLEVSV